MLPRAPRSGYRNGLMPERANVRLFAPLFAALLLAALAGCAGTGEAAEKPPDQRYGHRYAERGPDERGPDGRRALTIAPPDTSQRYFFYDVPVSDVIVRAAPFEPGEAATPVELLVKGGLPNECLALADAGQRRTGHFLNVALTMRRPQGVASCERYERPFRFYLPLDGRYEPGDYTLKLNGEEYPFTIRRED